MSRIYFAPIPATTVTNAGGNADIWELVPAANKPIKLRGLILGNTSEVGDAAEEGLEFQILRMTATVTSSNGSAGTIAQAAEADAAAGFTFEFNGATVATTSGSTRILIPFGWNIRNSPYEIWFPDDRFAPHAKNAEELLVRMISTPADDFTFVGCAIIEEE